ncbi:hypothetical protein K1T71_001729 [Dendrolimus kikuchii]|uniref:Uncharacterized protein n=1 Tax=Dendrolimus kikuchii TaxID=765133 RepID=A0ACC1DEW8_9NEOP|nr:hypothetical protein K1T71_001729 [Dendrolimus kikuchii]
MSDQKKKALFICLGNTCRSPIAEGVFQKTVNDMNLGDQWEIDSAAIEDWHVGDPPNWRSLDTLEKHHVPYNNHHARQITFEDFNYYDYIFGMDNENMKDLRRKAPKNCKAKLLLLGDFDPNGDKIIRDPYCDSHGAGFEKCYQQAVRCSKGFLEQLDKV